MEQKLRIDLQSADALRLSLQGEAPGTIRLQAPAAGTANYERLTHKPRINGVELMGDQSSEDLRIISENTVSGWAARADYIPRRGEICVYTDYAAVEDDQGHTLTVPGIKIGDGNAYLADLPFAGDDLRYLILRELRQHAGNSDIHVTPQEKAFWNAKLNYDVSGEELILNRN